MVIFLHRLCGVPHYTAEPIINEFVEYLFISKIVFFSIFRYSQVVQDTDSYTRLPQQQYLTNINLSINLGRELKYLHIHIKHTSL